MGRYAPSDENGFVTGVITASALMPLSGVFGIGRTKMFGTPGTFQFTVPDGITEVRSRIWGGAADANGTLGTTDALGGSGGGFSIKVITGLVPGQTITVTVGAVSGTSSFGTYGLPSCPYIQSILPHGLSLPKVPNGDQVWQHSDAVQQRVDADGNWLRLTDGKIRDHAIEREVEALGNSEKYQSHAQDVDHHSTEKVGGIKRIDALGALKLNSAGTATLAALDDMHQATGRDLNLVVGKKHNASVGGDMSERIQGLRESISKESQRLQAPKSWVGSESVNIFKVLCDTLDLLQEMNTQIAAHVHPQLGSPPTNAAFFSSEAIKVELLSTLLKSITL